MAGGPLIVFPTITGKQLNNDVNLKTDTLRLALLSDAWTPNTSTQSLWADISAHQINQQNGYAGPVTLTTGVQINGNGSGTLTANSVTWLASGGSLVAKYAVVYDDTGTGDPLVCYGLLDSTGNSVTVTNTLQLTVRFLSGVLTLNATT